MQPFFHAVYPNKKKTLTTHPDQCIYNVRQISEITLRKMIARMSDDIYHRKHILFGTFHELLNG